MSRAERLLALLNVLRQHRRPVSGQRLAEALGVSLRTVYRDIQGLAGQGAQIDGEAGVGFVLRPGFLLPPLMFSEAEIEALTLGAQWVVRRADPAMARAATSALSRIAAVLPEARRGSLDDEIVLAAPGQTQITGHLDLALVRQAIRAQTKLEITYADAAGQTSERLIWPMALAFFEQVRVIVAWCELRQDFRHFRADRIETATDTAQRYPGARRTLLRSWREKEGIPDGRGP